MVNPQRSGLIKPNVQRLSKAHFSVASRVGPKQVGENPLNRSGEHEDIVSTSGESPEKFMNYLVLRTAQRSELCEGVDGALKGVVSFVIPEGQEAYTPDNPDAKIDAYLSSLSIYKRMSLDVVKVGGITKILVEKKRLLKDKYLDRIKNELKKQ